MRTRADPYQALFMVGLAGAVASFLHDFPGIARAAGTLPALMPWLVSAAAALLVLRGMVLLRRARMIEDTPLSLARSAAQGYVELEGHARLLPGPEIISPLSRQRCTWWSYRVWQRRATVNGGNEWVLLEDQTSDDLFQLADTSGEVIIDPYGAKVLPSVDRSWRGRRPRPDMVPERSEWIGFGEYRYRERLLRVGDALYAAGEFRTQAAIAEFNESRDVTELLREWKKNQRELLRRFDTNHNGIIEPAEWEAARQAAQAQVRAQQLERATQPDLSILTHPSDGRPFLLSVRPQAQLVAQMRRRALLALLLAIAIGGGTDWVLRAAQGCAQASPHPGPACFIISNIFKNK
ncbi:MAG TPA: GIDE domain-containing protein, partial [Nevskiaceae bacterium]|nr:GIDE domain-containing protein [Nevskiaceae bacterium]